MRLQKEANSKLNKLELIKINNFNYKKSNQCKKKMMAVNRTGKEEKKVPRLLKKNPKKKLKQMSMNKSLKNPSVQKYKILNKLLPE